ncbi:hypothetical protein FKW77_001132 [Venturia effusa]|uniref:Prolyl 4-hydroxylase alpha subunit domain-containing protein n=1 Tax=Venturia effusa TaxID=50376 RepID=A0A517L4V4_9PEZI|nr:hypothetical protein FKW77_001132 [Venturia effusa]
MASSSARSDTHQALLDDILARRKFNEAMISSNPTSAPAPATAEVLPTDFLLGPHPSELKPKLSRIDFSKTELYEYDGLYATVIDDILSVAECEKIVELAEATTEPKGKWERAMVNIGGGRQAMYEDTRKCGRIIWDTEELARRLWERVEPLVPELSKIEGKASVTGWGPVKWEEVWRCVGLNERLRLLKYVGGEYFKAHCDGMYEAPNKERSYYTLHLYLNDTDHQADGEPLVGGATTFFAHNMERRLDVAPKMGSILIFQQRGLLHAGDDLVSGMKLTLRTDIMYEKTDEVAKKVEPSKVVKRLPAWVKNRRGGTV